MRLLAISLALTLSIGSLAQEAPQSGAGQSLPAAVATQKLTVTIPAGTRIPVTLTNTITTSATKSGDTLRVVTTFPVTVDTQLAIPAGTYIEGMIDKIGKKKSANQDVLKMHFTQLVFSNGYQVNLDGATAIAQVLDENQNARSAVAEPQRPIPGVHSFQQSPPTLPPPPHHGVPAALVAVAVGTTALVLVGVLAGRHRGHDVVFDVGSPFDLLLEKPLTLEIAKIPTVPPSV